MSVDAEESFVTLMVNVIKDIYIYRYIYYEESVVDKFRSNLLLMIFWLHIINYNSYLIK